jgi:hypothetical protein
VFEHHSDEDNGRSNLGPHADGAVVELLGDAQHAHHQHSEEGVHGADVVEHDGVVEGQADHDAQKVEAPHHLAEATDAEVPGLIVIGCG